MSNTTAYCASCGQQGHRRRTHRDCPLNSNNVQTDVVDDESNIVNAHENTDFEVKCANYYIKTICFSGVNKYI